VTVAGMKTVEHYSLRRILGYVYSLLTVDMGSSEPLIYNIEIKRNKGKIKVTCHSSILGRLVMMFSPVVGRIKKVRGNLYIVDIYFDEEKLKTLKNKK